MIVTRRAAFRTSAAAVAAALAASAAATNVAGSSTQLESDLRAQAPPPPASVPPNASAVDALVLGLAMWPPGSLQGSLPPIAADQPWYSLRLQIVTASPGSPDLDSHAEAGRIIEVFSADAPTCDLWAARISATVRLTGDTRGTRWWISDLVVSAP